MYNVELTIMEEDALEALLYSKKFKTVLIERIDEELAVEEYCENYKKTLTSLKNKIIKHYEELDSAFAKFVTF